MAGKAVKGTNDADGDGKKGGSLPLSDTDKLERRVKALEEAARLNGWTGFDAN
jgi:hypothetical protein